MASGGKPGPDYLSVPTAICLVTEMVDGIPVLRSWYFALEPLRKICSPESVPEKQLAQKHKKGPLDGPVQSELAHVQHMVSIVPAHQYHKI